MVLNGMGVGGALASKGVGRIALLANGLEQHSGFQSFFMAPFTESLICQA